MLTLDQIKVDVKLGPDGDFLLNATVDVSVNSRVSREIADYLEEAKKHTRESMWNAVYGDLIGPAHEVAALAMRSASRDTLDATEAACARLLGLLKPKDKATI